MRRARRAELVQRAAEPFADIEMLEDADDDERFLRLNDMDILGGRAAPVIPLMDESDDEGND